MIVSCGRSPADSRTKVPHENNNSLVMRSCRGGSCGSCSLFSLAELTRIIRHVAENREEWRAKWANARRLYEARFTWARESAALAAVYRQLLGQFTL